MATPPQPSSLESPDPQQQPPLLRIPNEILFLIADELPLSLRGPLLRTSRHLHELCTPDFYREALRDDRGVRGLRYAAVSGNVDVAAVFITRYGVPPNHPFRDAMVADQTCLHVAATRGHLDLVRMLLSMGADVGAKNEAGRTPLHHAAHGGAVEVAQALLDAGADVMARDEVQQTPLHSAAKKGHHRVCRLLLERGAIVDAMCKDPQNEVDDGYTALHGAADFGHTEVARLLLENGAMVDAKIEQSEWTPLGCSAAEGHEGVVRCLLAWGAEVNVGPEVPLRLAVDGKWHEGVLKLLLDHGADVKNALEGLFHTETATRLTDFAEKWKSGGMEGEAGGDTEMLADLPAAPVFSPVLPLVLPG